MGDNWLKMTASRLFSRTIPLMREWQKTCAICKQPATRMTKFGISGRKYDGSYRTTWVELPTCKNDHRMLTRLQNREKFGLRIGAVSLVVLSLVIFAYFMYHQTLLA